MRSGQRSCWAAVFALLLAMRLIMPTGFMPAWTNHQFQIAICDDAGAQLTAAHHDGEHGKNDKSKHRQSCPYAAASATPFLNPPATTIADPPQLASMAPDEVHGSILPPNRKIERPPSRAPPALA